MRMPWVCHGIRAITASMPWICGWVSGVSAMRLPFACNGRAAYVLCVCNVRSESAAGRPWVFVRLSRVLRICFGYATTMCRMVCRQSAMGTNQS